MFLKTHNPLIISLFFLAALLYANPVRSQGDYEKRFLAFFKKQSLAGKVNAFDTLKDNEKIKCFPYVKAELAQIKDKAIEDNKTEIIDQLTKIEGEILYYNKQYSKSITLFTDLLAKHKVKTYKDSARVLYCLKNSYLQLHSLNKAVHIHKTLMRLQQQHPDIDSWLFHPKLSTIYYEMKMYGECLEQQLHEYDEIKNSKTMTLGYFNNRGLFWHKYGNLDSALACFEKAKSIFFKMHPDNVFSDYDQFNIGLIEGNIGQVLMDRKEYRKAMPLLENDIKSSIKVKDFVNASISEIELAKCYMALNQLPECKKHLDKANEQLKSVDDYKNKLNVLKQYALYYDKTGAYRLSIDYYSKYIHMRDSFENDENIKELISTQVANQMNEKESVILENQKKIQEKNNEVDKQKTILKLLVFGGLVLILIIVMVSAQLKKSNAQKKLLELKNKQIETRNEIINKSLSEKDLLIKEVHHRVKNNLQIVSSLLKLQSAKSTNPEVISSLNEAQDRINSMALLHQLLYRNKQMTSLKFNEYLNNLITQIKEGFDLENKKIEIVANLIELELDLDTAIPLGLIANELISNSYKHAFTGNQGLVHVELQKLVKNTYVLKIRDNGKGLPENFDFDNLKSLGLDIVSILAEQLSARLKAYNDHGACFEIIFQKA